MRTVQATRKLTGNFYLRKRFFGGYRVMVEVEIKYFSLSYHTSRVFFEKANDADVDKLGLISTTPICQGVIVS